MSAKTTEYYLNRRPITAIVFALAISPIVPFFLLNAMSSLNGEFDWSVVSITVIYTSVILLSFSLWIYFEKQGFGVVNRLLMGLWASSVWLVILVAFLLRTDDPQFFKMSYLPFFHQANTVQSGLGFQEDAEDESLFVMRRKIVVGDVAQTLLTAQQDCTKSVSGNPEDFSCHIVSCDDNASMDGRWNRLSDLRASECNNADADEYLYILYYRQYAYAC